MIIGFLVTALFIGLAFAFLKPTLDSFVAGIVPETDGTAGIIVSAIVNGAVVLILLAVVGFAMSALGFRAMRG